MAVVVACACGKQYRVKSELRGKTLRCPACQQLLTVPAADASLNHPAVPIRRPTRRTQDPHQFDSSAKRQLTGRESSVPAENSTDTDDVIRLAAPTKRETPKQSWSDFDDPDQRCRNCGKRLRSSIAVCNHCGHGQSNKLPKRRRNTDPVPLFGRRYEKDHEAGQLLATAIIGLFCFGIVIGPTVVFKAISHLREMEKGRMDPSGQLLTIIALGLGILDTVGAIAAIWLMFPK